MSITAQQYGQLHFELWRVGAADWFGIASAPPNAVNGADLIRFISVEGVDVECEVNEALEFLAGLDDNTIENAHHFLVLLLPDDETPDPLPFERLN